MYESQIYSKQLHSMKIFLTTVQDFITATPLFKLIDLVPTCQKHLCIIPALKQKWNKYYYH